MKMRLLYIVLVALIPAIITNCVKKNWSQTVATKIQYQISTDSLTIAGKPLVIKTAALRFSDFYLNGERLQSEPISLLKSNATPINFLSKIPKKGFHIPIGTYTKMQLKTKLSSGQIPALQLSGIYKWAPNISYRFNIALNLEKDFIIDLKDVDQSTTILIDESLSKTMNVSLDLGVLFSGIDPSAWSNPTVTIQDGELTVEINETNNTDIKTAIENQVGQSLTVHFQ